MRYYRFERQTAYTEYGYFYAANQEDAEKIAAELFGPIRHEGDLADVDPVEVVEVISVVEEED